MFDTFTTFALFDLSFVLVGYLIIKFVSKWLLKNERTEVDEKFENSKFYYYYKKFHVEKIIYILLAIFVLRSNLEIVWNLLSDSTKSNFDTFAILNMLLVANVMTAIMIKKLSKATEA